MDAAKQEQKPCIQHTVPSYSPLPLRIYPLTFSVSFSRHSQTQDQNPIWSFSSLSISLIKLQPKTLCNETKHKRKLSHSLMQTSMDLPFSSLLFSGDYSGLPSSSVLVFPLVTIAACAGTDRRKEENEKQHRFSVSCCGQGRALPILVLVGRGEERELCD